MSVQNTTIHDEDNGATSAKAAALSTFDDLKGQASQAAGEAKATLNTIASDARSKLNDIVGQQKAAGADQIAGLARAAQSAAGDLENQSPQVARLVRDAAASVDRFANDLRERDVRDVLATVTDYARQQPVAFFAGSIVAGFALARFFRSEAPARTTMATGDHFGRTAGSNFREWSSAERTGTQV